MLSFLKNIQEQLFTLDINEKNDINKTNMVKYNKNINIDENLKIYDETFRAKICQGRRENTKPKKITRESVT